MLLVEIPLLASKSRRLIPRLGFFGLFVCTSRRTGEDLEDLEDFQDSKTLKASYWWTSYIVALSSSWDILVLNITTVSEPRVQRCWLMVKMIRDSRDGS